MLENGFNGFPRASRSIRARGQPIAKKCENVKSHQSFEILASVAGKLLDKSETHRTSCDKHSSPLIDPTSRIPGRSGTLDSCGKCAFHDHHCLSGAIETKREQGNVNNRRVKVEIDSDWTTSKSVGRTEEVRDEKRTAGPYDKSQKIYPFKKRKFFDLEPLSLSESDQRFHEKQALDSPPETQTNGKLSPNSEEECNVKLSIKSFKVPELFIGISTNATVGSLKRIVMKALTSILGDGLHVGILVEGKKVRDDNKTLNQTGISQDEKSHNLGFVLEPKHSLTVFKNEPFSSRHLVSQQETASSGCVGTELHSIKCLAGSSMAKAKPDSEALVAVPKTRTKTLDVAHLHHKPGHGHEYGQRRIRRPFSVSEVEALVRAVEKLGTGRWRDVKFYAFDNSNHRTYVDLKDKWKTLVHTARISPQQRRGEPVPQELLDRVLAAQAYWSHGQALITI